MVGALANGQKVPILHPFPPYKNIHFNLDLTLKIAKIALQPTITLNPLEFMENELNSLICMVNIDIIPWRGNFTFRNTGGGAVFDGDLISLVLYMA